MNIEALNMEEEPEVLHIVQKSFCLSINNGSVDRDTLGLVLGNPGPTTGH